MFQFSFNFESSERFFFFFVFFSRVYSLNFIFLLILIEFIISVESSVKLSFQQNSRVEFSFSCLTS